jgi:hypothetical protein
MIDQPKTVKEMAQVVSLVPKRENPQSAQEDICFVAMSFSKNSLLESCFKLGVKPALKKVHLKCVRVNEEHFTQRISDKIWEDVNRSKIVIVDLTEDSPNCYFEAGYALAQNIPIIFQRLVAPGYKARFPFHVQPYPHILYGDAVELRKILGERLASLLNKK